MMADDEPQDNSREIARLEEEIEALSQALERCRKIDMFAKIMLAAGAIWIVAALVGLTRFDGVALLGTIVAVIGGIVLSGSNRSTAEQTRETLAAKDAERAALIGTLDLQVIDGGGLGIAPGDPGRLH